MEIFSSAKVTGREKSKQLVLSAIFDYMRATFACWRAWFVIGRLVGSPQRLRGKSRADPILRAPLMVAGPYSKSERFSQAEDGLEGTETRLLTMSYIYRRIMQSFSVLAGQVPMSLIL